MEGLTRISGTINDGQRRGLLQKTALEKKNVFAFSSYENQLRKKCQQPNNRMRKLSSRVGFRVDQTNQNSAYQSRMAEEDVFQQRKFAKAFRQRHLSGEATAELGTKTKRSPADEALVAIF